MCVVFLHTHIQTHACIVHLHSIRQILFIDIYFTSASSPPWCLILLQTVDCSHCLSAAFEFLLGWLQRFCFVTTVHVLKWLCRNWWHKLITNTSRNQGHAASVLQSKLAPVSSVSGPNSHVIALIMQLLMLLTVFLFGTVLTVPETITNIKHQTKSEFLKYHT